MDSPSRDLDLYFTRLGVERRLHPTAATLAELHAAHVAAIPFENLDILLSRPIELDPDALFAKLVEGGRGGYCFEQNALFKSMLETIGFRVTALAARVRLGAPVVNPRTHMLLLVELPEGPVIADVGFGADGLVLPIPLAGGAEVRVPIGGHRLSREGDTWVLAGDATGSWTDLYAFTLEPQHSVDFVVANHYTSTHPASRFTQRLTAQRSWPEMRLVLRDRELTIRDTGGARTEPVHDPEHLLAVLRERFGLRFPGGTRFSAPAF